MLDKWGRRWELVRGYSVIAPEGWFLEMNDITDNPSGDIVLIARWPDGGELSIKSCRPDVTPEMVEWFTKAAKEAIAPMF